MKVAVVQSRHEASWDANLDAARRHLGEAAARGAEIALLPEYWFMETEGAGGPSAEATRAAAGRERELVRFLEDRSRSTGMLVAANVLHAEAGAVENVLVACEGGREAWRQTKIHPMPGEVAAGIVGGDGFRVHDARGLRLGGLVCADVLYPEAARLLALRRADVVLNPVLSRWRRDDPTRAARESVFVARAWDGACFVLKASGFLPGRIAGRSLVAAPWGLVARYADEAAEEVLVADLDLDALRAFRKEQRGLQDRRPDAYQALVDDDP